MFEARIVNIFWLSSLRGLETFGKSKTHRDTDVLLVTCDSSLLHARPEVELGMVKVYSKIQLFSSVLKNYRLYATKYNERRETKTPSAPCCARRSWGIV